MQGINIREADFARDKPAFLEFIMGSQRHEYAVEPNRRLDPPVADEHLARLAAYLEEHDGRIFVAEDLAPMLGEVAPRAASLPLPAASPKETPLSAPEPDRWVEPAEGVDDALANLERILKRQDPLLARYGRAGEIGG